MNRSIRFTTPLLVALSLGLLGLGSLWSPTVEAHKGHGGPMVKFMKTKAALKALLPKGAKVVKRKSRLSDDSTEWAESTFGIDLDNRIHTYFLARDRNSGKTLAGAIIMKFSYRHGDVMLGVGVDAEQKLTGAVIQGISEKYIPDFEGTVGKGILSGYAGKTVAELAQAAKSHDGDKPSRFIAEKLAEEAALMAAFLHQSK